MSRTQKWIVLLLVVFGLSLACSLNPTPVPEPTATEDRQAIIETSVAATLAAQPTEVPPTDEPAPAPTDTLEPTAEPTEEPTPGDVVAPDPLGPGYTGLIFDFGTCYDFDTYQPVPEGDASVDACLNPYGMLSFYNGALMSGYATFDPPTRNDCMASALSPGDLAPNSDLYLCLQTSLGSYGFFVERDLQLDQNRFTFDLYIFP